MRITGQNDGHLMDIHFENSRYMESRKQYDDVRQGY
jgi:hypothetical protein